MEMEDEQREQMLGIINDVEAHLTKTRLLLMEKGAKKEAVMPLIEHMREQLEEIEEDDDGDTD